MPATRGRPTGSSCWRSAGSPDGRWRPGGRWWKPPGSKGSNVEVVDWGSGPSDLLTLDALRVLQAADPAK